MSGAWIVYFGLWLAAVIPAFVAVFNTHKELRALDNKMTEGTFDVFWNKNTGRFSEL